MRRAKDQLNEIGVKPSKTRGQNFTIDTSVIDRILSFSPPNANEKLVEIGPGLGAMTEKLIEVGDLTAIEIEPKFAALLKAKLPKLTVIEKDVREVDFKEIGSELVVYGNLPYSFSSDIVLHLIRSREVVSRAVLLLQKEFSERLAARPNTRDYGSLSIAVQYWADVKLGPIVPGNSFHPPTKVDSQVVVLEFYKEPPVKASNFKVFERVVRAAFVQRRKKLRNSLVAGGVGPKDLVDRLLDEAGINGDRRAETLEIFEFVKLAESFIQMSVSSSNK